MMCEAILPSTRNSPPGNVSTIKENVMTIVRTLVILSLLVSTLATPHVGAQTVRVGVLTTTSGPSAIVGELMDRSIKLYMKQNADKLPPGVKVELFVRDDGGPNPDKARQLAQELIIRDKVQLLTGFPWTPNAMAIAPLATEAKVPMLVMNAAASVLTTRSPYIARFSFTLWQSSYPLGEWAAKRYKRAYISVSDFVGGYDAEEAFERAFTAGGGEIIGKVHVPLVNPDFVPFIQRVKDAKPDVLFAQAISAGQSTQIMKAFSDLGLDKAGIRFIGSGDLTSDDQLPNMGDAPLGLITMHHYSAAADRPANRAFVAAWKKEYGERSVPNFQAVAAWDTMDAIYQIIREQNGVIDPDKTMALLKQYKNPNSPRGPISIDPDTRDIVQNQYLREVRRVNGQLANVELETIPNVKDQWKEFNQKR